MTIKEYKEILKGSNNGKHGFGVRLVYGKYNKTHLNNPYDRKLRPTTVLTRLESGCAGLSPQKCRRRETIPPDSTKALVAHA